MDWRLLIAKKTVLARVPCGVALRRVKRSLFGYQPDSNNMRTTIENYRQIKTAAAACGVSFENATVLEIGSGWFPVIPISLCKDGAKQVFMTDLNPHMDDVTFKETIRHLVANFAEYQSLRGIETPAQLPLKYLAPFNVAAVADASLDLVVSRTVLEHIPADGLKQMFSSLHRKMKPGGHMVHLVDHSDHLQHQDRSLSRVNFLTWSSRYHAGINRLIQEGENRLRHHEYKAIFELAGFRVVAETAEADGDTLRRCVDLKLAPPFDSMTHEQLSVMTSIYVVRA